MKKQREYNLAYVDGQNLHLGTASGKWKVDFKKFRIYLKEKLKVEEAYYFLGFLDEEQEKLYSELQKAGFIIIFREHTSVLKGKKKGNVDVDMVFEIMRRILDDDDFDKIVLVSGDGDYIKPVKWLIKNDRLKKILFPNKQYSSLYKQIQDRFSTNISLKDVRMKFEYKGSHKRKTKKPQKKRQYTKKE